MIRLLRCLCMVGLLAIVVTGCGQPVPESPPGREQPPALDSKAEVKQRLESIAESGYGGSGLAGLREGLEKLGDKSLVSDLDSLEKAESDGNTEKVKQIAKQMADKL